MTEKIDTKIDKKQLMKSNFLLQSGLFRVTHQASVTLLHRGYLCSRDFFSVCLLQTLLGIFLLLPAQQVLAAADDDISNTATISFIVGGATSTMDAVATFKEDRVINFSVQKVNDGNYDPVIEGFSGAVMPFSIVNRGNDVQDFLLSAVNTTANPFSSPADNFDTLQPLRVYVESGITPGYQVAEDIQVFVDELQANSSVEVYLVADMPAEIKPDDVAAVALVVQVAQGGAAGVEGLALNQDDNGHISPASPASGYSNGTTTVLAGSASSKPDTLSLETVFNDPAGNNVEDVDSLLQQDIASNGQHSDAGAFKVVPPVVIVNSVKVIDSDGNSEPRPGATLRYQLDVRVAGNTSVNDLVVRNPVPLHTTYIAGSITLNNNKQTDADDPQVDFTRVVKNQNNSVTSIEIDLSEAGNVSVAPGENPVITFEVTID